MGDGHICRCLHGTDLLFFTRDAVSADRPSDAQLDTDMGPRYVRHLEADTIEQNAGFNRPRKRLFAQLSFGRISPKPISFLEFFRPLYMLKYPSVGLIAFSWCLGVAMPDIGISNIVPIAFGKVYGWSPYAQGLSNTGFLVGCIIGEAFAGKVSDVVSGRCPRWLGFWR